MSECDEAFTLVFKGDIRQFKISPFKTESPWGIPYAASRGDALAELDKLRESTEPEERNPLAAG